MTATQRKALTIAYRELDSAMRRNLKRQTDCDRCDLKELESRYKDLAEAYREIGAMLSQKKLL